MPLLQQKRVKQFYISRVLYVQRLWLKPANVQLSVVLALSAHWCLFMVEKSIVLDTIKKMYASGLSDEVIESTLRDIGLGEKEIKKTIAEARSIASPAESAAEENDSALDDSETNEKIAEATAKKVKQHLEERSEADALAHTTTQAAIAGYDSRLVEIANRLSNIERKVNSIAGFSDFSAKAVSLDKKISAIESDLSELKAISNALKSLLEKVLDTDRSVLSELEEKK